jgi:hypothetical protein
MVGQEKPARPLYPLPRYEEDWNFLSDPAKRNDFSDPIKFDPLNEDRNVFSPMVEPTRLRRVKAMLSLPADDRLCDRWLLCSKTDLSGLLR